MRLLSRNSEDGFTVFLVPFTQLFQQLYFRFEVASLPEIGQVQHVVRMVTGSAW